MGQNNASIILAHFSRFLAYHAGYSLRLEGKIIYKEPIKNYKFCEDIFLNRIVPVWKKHPISVKEAEQFLRKVR